MEELDKWREDYLNAICRKSLNRKQIITSTQNLIGRFNTAIQKEKNQIRLTHLESFRIFLAETIEFLENKKQPETMLGDFCWLFPIAKILVKNKEWSEETLKLFEDCQVHPVKDFTC